MSVHIALPHSIGYKAILPNACWVETQNDQKDALVLVSVPCDDVSSIVLIDLIGKRIELCFLTGSIVKIENNTLFYDKNRLEECDSE